MNDTLKNLFGPLFKSMLQGKMIELIEEGASNIVIKILKQDSINRRRLYWHLPIIF